MNDRVATSSSPRVLGDLAKAATNVMLALIGSLRRDLEQALRWSLPCEVGISDD